MNENIITAFKAKRQQLINEANLYANDMRVPLQVSLEIYAQIDRLNFAIKQLEKRER